MPPSTDDPILGMRIEARQLAAFEVVEPDGSEGRATYVLKTHAWWPESVADPRFCREDDDGERPYGCSKEDED